MSKIGKDVLKHKGHTTKRGLRQDQQQVSKEHWEKYYQKQTKSSINQAKKKLDDLISEIEDEGSSLSEHGCWMVLEDLKEIRKLLKEER